MFPIHYFNGISEFKKMVNFSFVFIRMTNEFQQLIGDTRVMLATKKRSLIGNVFVRNKQLSTQQQTTSVAKLEVVYNVRYLTKRIRSQSTVILFTFHVT